MKGTDNIFVSNGQYDGYFTSSERLYACKDPLISCNCFRCIGKANCRNYRHIGYGKYR